jgi:hypothetical protein
MRNLVRRYVTVEQRKSDNQGVTEDDVNEIKQDISAFRCELIEVLKNSGMNTSTATGVGQGISFGSLRGKLRIYSYYYFPWGHTYLHIFFVSFSFYVIVNQILITSLFTLKFQLNIYEHQANFNCNQLKA